MTNKIFGLGIAASPLQVINIFEASDYWKTENLCLILFTEGNDLNKKQIEEVLTCLNFKGDVHWVLDALDIKGKIEQIKTFLKLKKQIKTSSFYKRKIEYLFIGHISSIYHCSIASLFSKADKIYVDDGTGSIYDINFINKKGFHRYENKIKNKLLYLFIGIKPFPIQSQYLYFTFYYDQFPKLNSHLKLFPNKFSLTRRIGKKSDVDSKVVAFVGQSMVDLKIISSEDYLDMLIKTKNYFEEKDRGIAVTYYAHRNESDEILDMVRDKLQWEVVRNDLPLELYFLFNKRPAKLGLFFSSVSQTISMIFKKDEMEILAFKIPQKILKYRNKEIEKVYGEIALNDRIEVIEEL
ncbi:hypothetical protein LS482_08935 [Sinomicrobium kalidii]|uniref:polysialyltransferase family glycosyltransferase n=1 Tax=Sinomicrobium kalidii TaxID=2900738 RepID=UPI001E3E0AA2|nr:hypothetical protein [Sinomicrobium kalidii]UGU17993.1 hypothetical protein LS482_08935 [Sinomicrobium kalidii]